jgi:hypothetical protein
MDLSRRSVALCAEGTQAEFEGRVDDARRLYAEAWGAAEGDYDRCVAAHYVAHLEPDAAEQLRWNALALEHAAGADQTLVAPFYASLYVSLGRSYELAGAPAQAQRYYALAAELGLIHQPERAAAV